MTARLQRQGELGLRDAFGSTLVAMCLSRPPQRSAPPLRLPASTLAPAPALSQSQSPTMASGAAPVRVGRVTAGAVTDDPAVAEAYALVEAAVRRGLPLLLTGETGTGKEMLARHAHGSSGRTGAFVAVNCGALPAELIEAELFGYVGGAFSGARREGSIGLIASADGGTLLLDELGELPLPLQASLLRFLDDRQVRPVGGTAVRSVDVQLLAATHADLEAEVPAKRFRADLLYRLNTVTVSLPPLRQRSDFAQAVRAVLGAVDSAASITDEAIQTLAGHGWPGNFRELRSVLTRALLQGSSRIQAAAVAPWLPAAEMPLTGPMTGRMTGPAPRRVPMPAAAAGSALQQNAAELVQREFERSGNVSATARALGISRTTVYRHLRQEP